MVLLVMGDIIQQNKALPVSGTSVFKGRTIANRRGRDLQGKDYVFIQHIEVAA